MAGKTNDSESEIDKTTFFWVGLCGICHPGGGAGEFDRDGELLFDVATGEFGYEKLGKSSAEVVLDGDYSVINTGNGDLKAAPWDVTGLSEPDCLLCHGRDRVADFEAGKNMNWIWRAASLRGREGLKDAAGNPVPAYAAAPAAAQGWFTELSLAKVPAGKPPLATTLQLSYVPGLEDGSLLSKFGDLQLNGDQILAMPKDLACWGCHAGADMKKRGRVWFDADQDVHYAGLNHLDDADADNDVLPENSQACAYCHPANRDHSIRKGNSFLGSVEDETDYEGLRTCADCHTEGGAKQDEHAPAMPTEGYLHNARHLATMACQVCHITRKDLPADLVVDNATKGSTIAYKTSVFLSADPLDPANEDKSSWYPGFRMKKDRDGVERLYPAKPLLSIWWGDWDRGGTPDAYGDDVVAPIPLWRVRGATKGQPLVGVTDDNGDGIPEVNRHEEILIYITTLRGPDRYGNPLAENPVLVKGGKIWFEDPKNPGNVLSMEYHGTGMQVESTHTFSMDHNVRNASEAWGVDGQCYDCHQTSGTPVFDRLILTDPFGPDANATPEYETVRELTGSNPN